MGKRAVRPSQSALEMALDKAWTDHHHARDQTWKSLQAEVTIGVGLFGASVLFPIPKLTLLSSGLLALVSISAIMITWRHRNAVERRCFIHITKLERALGLKRCLGKTRIPRKLRYLDIIDPRENNTSLFILRMHVAILVFAALFGALVLIRG